ncbi:hypothetical protein BDQ12DRAFT_666796 [Crucibulum laeve]|uniref:Uncharacterized protein n=1 Tax=Crucibulum laeve TaxID=68775 RepID=A0A5C3LWI3_9AGAR|nr:hypothetical protein BDQ12DRAFT_666796 [Crucibulum laeve]
MSDLKSHAYRIRIVPKGITSLDFAGGMYATAPSKVGEPVRTEALGPSATGSQIWQVKRVVEDEGNYIISIPFDYNGPFDLPGWQHHNKPSGGEHVTYGTDNLSYFRITPADLPGAYHIGVLSDSMAVGVLYAVGESEGNNVIIKSYALYPGYDKLLTRWQFIPVESSEAVPPVVGGRYKH